MTQDLLLASISLTIRIPKEIYTLIQNDYHPYTKELHLHGARVAVFADRLGKILNLSVQERNIFVTSAYLHDLGKLFIPVDILIKPSSLTQDEFYLMKTHPGIGAMCLKNFDGYERIARIIEQHHERIDGTGYPNKYTLQHLDTLSPHLSVVDAYCAMVENRPYKKTLSLSEADNELQRGIGTQFHEQSVLAFLKIERTIPVDLL